MKLFRHLAALVLATSLLASCTPSAPETSPDAGKTLDPVPSISNPLGECARNTFIGAALSPETGDLQALQGAQLAAEQLTSRGSFNYEIQEPTGPLEETTRAAIEDGAAAIIGPTDAEDVSQVVDAAADSQVAVLALADGDGVSSTRLFSLAMNDFRILTQTLVFMNQVVDARTVAVVRGESGDLSKAAADDLAKALSSSDLKVIEEVSFQEGGAAAALRKANASSPDMIFVQPSLGEEAAFLQTAGALELSAPLVGGPQFHDPQVVAAGGAGAEGMFVGTVWDPVSIDPINERFVAAFEDKFGAEPDVDAALGYAAVILVAGAVEEACSNDRAEVLKGLMETRDASSPLGRVSFTRTRDVIHPSVVVTVRDGAFVLP